MTSEVERETATRRLRCLRCPEGHRQPGRTLCWGCLTRLRSAASRKGWRSRKRMAAARLSGGIASGTSRP